MTETKAVYHANGFIETVEEPGTALPARLLVGGYPVLLADHCELADRVAALEARIAQLEAGAVRVIDAKLLGY